MRKWPSDSAFSQLFPQPETTGLSSAPGGTWNPLLRIDYAIKLLLSVFSMMLCLCAPARANNVYIAQSAQGEATGADCADALVYTYFNNPSNWTSGTPSGTKIGPGTTVYICGTITGSAGAQLLTFNGSGTSDNPITLEFQSGASLEAPYFAAQGAIYMSGLSNLVVNGGTNGLIEATLAGSKGASCPGGSCQYQGGTVNGGKAILAGSCTNCTVENLTIADMYVHTQCEASSGCDTSLPDFNDAAAVYFSGSGFTITNNTCHDAGVCWYNYAEPSGDSGYTISDNDMYNMDHGYFGGPCGTGCTLGTISIHDNHIHDSAAWDTGSADAYHHDGIHFWDGHVGTTTEIDIYNNLFDGVEGECCITAWLYMQGSAATNNIYNNVFMQTIPVPNGSINLSSETTGATFNLYNNTLVSSEGGGGNGPGITYTYENGEQSTVVIENNVFAGFNTFIALPSTDVTTLNADYNAYGSESGGGNQYWNWQSFSTRTFSSWQSECSCDTHSILGAGGVSGSLSIELSDRVTAPYLGQPLANSPVINAGTDLANLGIAALDSSTSLGNNLTPIGRGASWYIGAFQASSNVTPPAAPSGLKATVE
ncbi:MAG TPA: hypothetical protein VEJ67_11680 [Candidatus Cybelea sp.]|nr:hypothetical protein [Candidatus Cybelea sp.]